MAMDLVQAVESATAGLARLENDRDEAVRRADAADDAYRLLEVRTDELERRCAQLQAERDFYLGKFQQATFIYENHLASGQEAVARLRREPPPREVPRLALSDEGGEALEDNLRQVVEGIKRVNGGHRELS